MVNNSLFYAFLMMIYSRLFEGELQAIYLSPPMTLTRSSSFSSSRTFPVPRTTEVNGSSERITGICVLSTIILSRPYNSEPPPVSRMPFSKISEVSSGGASSKTSALLQLFLKPPEREPHALHPR